jgi:hypothetical protein
LFVDAARWPGRSRSSFTAAHIEHPACRSTTPASANTRSSPSATAWRRTAADPGTRTTSTPSATLRPASTAAAERRSSIRLLVHEPMNTVSTATSRIAVPGLRSM